MKRYRNLQKDLFKSMQEPEDRVDMPWEDFKRSLRWRWLLGMVVGAVLLYVAEVSIYVWYYGIG